MVDKQLKERTELTHSRIGKPQRDSILAAGLALQQAGVIDAKVDVKATVDALIDDQVALPTTDVARRTRGWLVPAADGERLATATIA